MQAENGCKGKSKAGSDYKAEGQGSSGLWLSVYTSVHSSHKVTLFTSTIEEEVGTHGSHHAVAAHNAQPNTPFQPNVNT